MKSVRALSVLLLLASGQAPAATVTEPGQPARARVIASRAEEKDEVLALIRLARSEALANPELVLAEYNSTFPQVQGDTPDELSLKPNRSLTKVLYEDVEPEIARERGVFRKTKVFDHYEPATIQVPVYRDELVRERVETRESQRTLSSEDAN